MAADLNNIYMKVGIDTSGFDSSLKGMMAEVKKLKGAVGNSILSAEEQRLVLSRMGSIKDEIADIQEGTSKLGGFELFARSIGGLSAGLAAVTGTMKLMGIENKELNKVMEISQVVMAASLSIQQLLDLQNIKTAISTRVVTAAQWLWNVALTANPIGAVVIAVTALIAALTLLTVWLVKSAQESDKVAEENVKLAKSYAAVGDAVEANMKRIKELDDKRGEREKSYAKENLRFIIEQEKAKSDYKIAMAQLTAKMTRAIEDGDIDAQKNLEFQKQSLVEITNNATKKRNERHKKELADINEKFDKIDADKRKTYNDKIASDSKAALDAAKAARAKDLADVTTYYDQLIAERQAKGGSGTADDTYNLQKDKLEALLNLTKNYTGEELKIREALMSQLQVLESNRVNSLKELGQKEIEITKEVTNLRLKNAETITGMLIDSKNTEIDRIKELIDKGFINEKTGSEQLKKLYEEKATLVDQQTGILLQQVQSQIDEENRLYQQKEDKTDADYALHLEKLKQFELDKAKIVQEGEAIINTPTQEGQDKAMERQKAAFETYKQGALEGARKISDGVFGLIAGSAQKAMDEALSQLDKTYEKSYQKLDKLKEQNQITDEEYARRKEKLDKEKEAKATQLRKEKAQKDKTAAIIQATINTAIAVTAALTGGPILGEALAIVTAALGAIEIALIAAQPLAYKTGGLVKRMAKGGLLNGPSHSQGGIPLYAEGGEFIINKSTVQQPGMLDTLTRINNNTSSGGAGISVINPEDLRKIVESVISIPVNVVETDITRNQRKVSSMEARSAW